MTTSKLPRAVIKHGDDMTKAGAKVTRLALEGWGLKKQIDELKAQQDKVNEQLKTLVPVGSTVLVHEEVQVPITERETISVADATGLKRVLGRRFGDLVEEKTTYKVLPKLKTMAADGDDKVGNEAREFLSYNHSVNVSYRGGKALPEDAGKQKAA